MSYLNRFRWLPFDNFTIQEMLCNFFLKILINVVKVKNFGHCCSAFILMPELAYCLTADPDAAKYRQFKTMVLFKLWCYKVKNTIIYHGTKPMYFSIL